MAIVAEAIKAFPVEKDIGKILRKKDSFRE
jgi:hypothetical protein